MLSHAFIRSTACCLNSVQYRSRFLRSTLQLLSCKVSNTEMYHFRGSFQKERPIVPIFIASAHLLLQQLGRHGINCHRSAQLGSQSAELRSDIVVA
jgi:hypothetical protein